MKLKTVFAVCITGCLLSFYAWSEPEVLSDDIILQKLSLFEKASQENDKVFFQNNLDIDARVTIHSKQRDSKHVVEFSKPEVVEGKLNVGADLLNHLERTKFDIAYYNNNTQGLLTYTMKPKKGSDLGKEKGYSVETEMLFQIVKGEIKIMKVIAHIDLEPNYQPGSH